MRGRRKRAAATAEAEAIAKAPYVVLVGGGVMTGDFSIEGSEDVVPSVVWHLKMTPYDRLTADPVDLLVVIDPTDVETLTRALTSKAQEVLSV